MTFILDHVEVLSRTSSGLEDEFRGDVDRPFERLENRASLRMQRVNALHGLPMLFP